jgi:hypothetical protein
MGLQLSQNLSGRLLSIASDRNPVPKNLTLKGISFVSSNQIIKRDR